MLLSEKFFGVRLVVVSIFAVLQSIYQINVVLICGIYFELFTSPIETFENYCNYFDRAEHPHGNNTLVASDEYVLQPHIRAMFFYFLWMATSLSWFCTNIPLFACSLCSKLIGKGCAKHVFIPWIVTTIVCTFINLVTIPDMFYFANLGERPWTFLSPNMSIFYSDKPITTAKNDNAIDLIPQMIGYCVAYYIFIAIPLITVSVLIAIHDCILLWQRPEPSEYAFFIKAADDMPNDELNKDSFDEIELRRYGHLSRGSNISRHSFYSSAVMTRDSIASSRASTNVEAPDRSSSRSSRSIRSLSKSIHESNSSEDSSSIMRDHLVQSVKFQDIDSNK